MLLFKTNAGPLKEGSQLPKLTLRLDYGQRASYRLRTTSDDGSEVGIILPRASRLCRPHDVLVAEDGTQALIKAANEDLIEAQTSDPLLFARACYHLGNRHLPLQITADALYFAPDKVIEDLCLKLGLALKKVKRPFEPESGAYNEHSHSHGDHDHHHEAGHAHHHEHGAPHPHDRLHLAPDPPKNGMPEILTIVRKNSSYHADSDNHA